jgi:hypothetical protein
MAYQSNPTSASFYNNFIEEDGEFRYCPDKRLDFSIMVSNDELLDLEMKWMHKSQSANILNLLFGAFGILLSMYLLYSENWSILQIIFIVIGVVILSVVGGIFILSPVLRPLRRRAEEMYALEHGIPVRRIRDAKAAYYGKILVIVVLGAIIIWRYVLSK